MINALSRSSLSAGSHSRSEPDQTPERTGLTKRKSELVSGLTSIENISLKRLKIFQEAPLTLPDMSGRNSVLQHSGGW